MIFINHISKCLPSVATDDRNQFQCLKIFLNNKFAALFLGLILGGDGKDPVMDYHTLYKQPQPYYEARESDSSNVDSLNIQEVSKVIRTKSCTVVEYAI